MNLPQDFLNAYFECRDVVLNIKIGIEMAARKSTNFKFLPILGLIVMEDAKPFEIGFIMEIQNLIIPMVI